MAGETIVFFPKYTSLAGSASPGTPYTSDPYEVISWKQVEVEILVVQFTASGTGTALLQESSDLLTWTDIGTASALTAGTVKQLSETNPARYLRLVITITVNGAVATLWAKAVARDA